MSGISSPKSLASVELVETVAATLAAHTHPSLRFEAVSALTAGDKGIERNSASDAESLPDRRTGTQFLDDAHDLVSENSRERMAPSVVPISTKGVDVGVAQPVGLDTDEHLTRLQGRDGYFLELDFIRAGLNESDRCAKHPGLFLLGISKLRWSNWSIREWRPGAARYPPPRGG